MQNRICLQFHHLLIMAIMSGHQSVLMIRVDIVSLQSLYHMIILGDGANNAY